MVFRVCLALLFCLAACASTPPASPSVPRSSPFASTPASHPPIQFVSARTDSKPSPIGRADLEQARALLIQARDDLEPRQWEALAGKLTAAERAFEHFSQATKAAGQKARVVRGMEDLSQLGRAKTWVKDLSRVGPLLGFLVLLYPFSTAEPEVDRRPEWLDAQWDYEARLRELSEESRRLMDERAAQDAKPHFDSASLMAAREPRTWWNTVDPATGRTCTV